MRLFIGTSNSSEDDYAYPDRACSSKERDAWLAGAMQLLIFFVVGPALAIAIAYGH
jgi:hypothetical protein